MVLYPGAASARHSLFFHFLAGLSAIQRIRTKHPPLDWLQGGIAELDLLRDSELSPRGGGHPQGGRNFVPWPQSAPKWMLRPQRSSCLPTSTLAPLLSDYRTGTTDRDCSKPSPGKSRRTPLPALLWRSTEVPPRCKRNRPSDTKIVSVPKTSCQSTLSPPHPPFLPHTQFLNFRPARAE